MALRSTFIFALETFLRVSIIEILQWRKWRTAFPDINFAVEEIVAEGDTVITRWRLTGTHLGEYLGKEATGIKVDVDSVSIDRIKGGMVVSGFDSWD
jgi:predicted ester cyclase